MIIFMQQAVQYVYRFLAAICFFKLSTRPYQAFVAVGHITAAGIAHDVFSK
jgi:hypothetical protein